jgi:OmpA-OmpF porin, OOP family
VLFEDYGQNAPEQVDIEATLPPLTPEEQYALALRDATPTEIAQALSAPPIRELEQQYSLRQVRENERLRWLAPAVELDTLTFASGSADLGTDQVRALDTIGRTLAAIIRKRPDEVFLVEGHTDAVGSDLFNLTLSDRRAENVALLLSELYDVPPENLVTQGYGEQYLKVPTLGPSRDNRRVDLRRITDLLK